MVHGAIYHQNYAVRGCRPCCVGLLRTSIDTSTCDVSPNTSTKTLKERLWRAQEHGIGRTDNWNEDLQHNAGLDAGSATKAYRRV